MIDGCNFPASSIIHGKILPITDFVCESGHMTDRCNFSPFKKFPISKGNSRLHLDFQDCFEIQD
jgi:hypothetical protein